MTRKDIILKNGNTLDAAMQMFRKKKSATKKKLGKYAYHSIDEYTKLLDACFGLTGYVVHYSDGRAFALASGQDILMVKATIDIVDEDGCVVYQMEGYGSYEPITESGGTKHQNLQNAGVIVNGYALKAACASAGAFGMRPYLPNEDEEGMLYSAEEDESKPVREATPVVKQKTDTAKPAKADAVRIKVYTVGKGIENMGQDKNGDDYYRLECTVEQNGQRVSTYVMFYHNNIDGNVEKFNKLTEALSTGSKMSVNMEAYLVADRYRAKGYDVAYTFKSFI